MDNKQNRPKPTAADYLKRDELQRRMNDANDGITDIEYLNFLNSFNWKTEIFEKDGKHGLVSPLGEVLLPPQYDDFMMLSHQELKKGDRVVAMQNGKWGVIIADGQGTWLIEPQYDYIGYPNSITQVRKGDKWGVLDLDKKDFLIPLECDKIYADSGYMFVNGIGAYEKSGKMGFITIEGKFTQPIFDDTDWDVEGLLKVKLNDQWGYVTEGGQFTLIPDEAYYVFED